MVTIRHKILRYVVAPNPVVNINIDDFETGILDVSASIWRNILYQLLVLSANQLKNQLHISDYVSTLTIQKCLITVNYVLAISMFPDVLRMRGGTRAHSDQKHGKIS